MRGRILGEPSSHVASYLGLWPLRVQAGTTTEWPGTALRADDELDGKTGVGNASTRSS